MIHMKSITKFVIGFSILHLITYFFAGIIAQKVLGASEFYPPSLSALSYLRDPLSSHVQMLFMPGTINKGPAFCSCSLALQKADF